MTDKAQQEAERLIEMFQNELSGVLYSPHNNVSARQCAVICVNMLIEETPPHVSRDDRDGLNNQEFWQSVLNILKEK